LGQPSQQEGTEKAILPQLKHIGSSGWAGSRGYVKLRICAVLELGTVLVDGLSNVGCFFFTEDHAGVVAVNLDSLSVSQTSGDTIEWKQHLGKFN